MLKREIYEKLLLWKNKNSGKVLVLEGARQVGKTYILEQFSKEYPNHIYINMIGVSGNDFLKCMELAMEWKPGEKRIKRPLHKALSLFETEFQDTDIILWI